MKTLQIRTANTQEELNIIINEELFKQYRIDISENYDTLKDMEDKLEEEEYDWMDEEEPTAKDIEEMEQWLKELD